MSRFNRNGLYNARLLNIVGTQLIVLFVLLISIFTHFYVTESGDMNVVVFGTFLYLGFILIFCLYNGFLIHILNGFNKRFVVGNYIGPVIPLLIWYIATEGHVTVGNWHLSTSEFFVTMLLVLICNLAGYLLIKPIKQ